MSYTEVIAAGYMAENNLNCAETMLRSANEFYDIGLSTTALQAANAFGGGFGKERACGALIGSLMALGCMFATERAHYDARMREIRNRFVDRFIETFGTSECAEIKQTHKDPVTGCLPVVAGAARILEETIASYRVDS